MAAPRTSSSPSPLAPSPLARTVATGLSIAVRVTPRSSRDCIDGVEARGMKIALKVRVRAAPEDGKANAAVTALVADFLDLPKRAAALTAGHTSRDKTVTVSGDSEDLRRRLDVKLGSLS